MSQFTLRQEKGSPLTWQELDDNFERAGALATPFATIADFQANAPSLELPAGRTAKVAGFYSEGDGGAGTWLSTGNAIAINQLPADTGKASLSDVNGSEWVFVGNALFTEQVGGKLDDSTDNSLITAVLLNWVTTTGKNVYIGIGTYRTNSISLASLDLKFIGLDEIKSIVKLNNGQDNHLVALTGTGQFVAKNITLDQNRANQAAGHGIRSGGCDRLTLDHVTVQNCNGYGIGLQAGTSKRLNWNDITIHTVGRDGIDVKDYDNANETLFLTNYKCSNHGLDLTQQVALDIRGPAKVVNVSANIQGENYGVRFRHETVQGRAGFGSMKGVDITGDGVNAGSIALDAASDSADWQVIGLTVRNMGLVIRQSTDGVGGIVTGVTARDIFGTDCFSFAGSDLIINGISASNTAASSRIMDFEPTADNIQINDFLLKNNAGGPTSIRVQSGCQDIALNNGVTKGGGIEDNGTATNKANVRIL